MRTLLVILVLFTATANGAEPTRILRHFDFEERSLGNDEDQPMHWDKQSGIGLPDYLTGQLSTDRARSGRYSFRIDLNGGSCVYQYQPGRIRVEAGAHYRIDGWCQTTPLAHARARLTAYFADAARQPIEESVKHSEAVTADDWKLLTVELTADADRAVSLVVEMELLQPDRLGTAAGTEFNQDIRGSAWFDDLVVSQVPEVTLLTDRPGNVFRRGDPGVLQVIVSDRSPIDLTPRLIVTDIRGRKIYQRTGAVEGTSVTPQGPGRNLLKMPLPVVPPGWYRASIEMVSQGARVGLYTLDWVQCGDDPAGMTVDPRFGITATSVPFDGWDELAKLLPTLSAGRVELPLWGPDGDVARTQPKKLDAILESLESAGVETVGCLLTPPPGTVDDWGSLSTVPVEQWQAPLSIMISRNAHAVSHWQIGTDDATGFASDPKLRQAFATVAGQFNKLLDKPDLAMPCPIWHELPPPEPASLTLSVPTAILPAELPLYLREATGHSAKSATISLTPLEGPQYDRQTVQADFVKRVVTSLDAGVGHIQMPLPVRFSRHNDRLIEEPTELLLPMRTLLTNLAGTTCRGRLPVGDGVEAYLFDKGGVGTLVVWTDRSDDVLSLAVDLDAGGVAIDLSGNQTPLPRTVDDLTADAAAGRIDIRVTRVPVLLTGVNVELGRLRAGIAFDRPLIESSFQSHTRRLRFVNPYPQPISGTVRLKGPAGWTMTPGTISFSLNAGEALERDVTMEFPFNSVAGLKIVSADITVQANRRHRLVVPLKLTLGLTDVGTQTLAFRDGKDVVVQQMITNYGEKPIDYAAFASMPGKPRIDRLVQRLDPGRTTIKKYRFTDVPPGPPVRVRVGLKEVDGNRVLNDETEIR